MKIADRLANENRGFSLIEVIVVVLIIGITSTIAVLSVGYAYGSSANHCAKRLSSLLDLTRTQSMGMVDGSILLRLERNSNDEYEAISIRKVFVGGVEQEIVLDREEIGNSALIIYYKDTVYTELTRGNHIDFVYHKNSGAFASNYIAIKIIGSKTAIVTMVKETGRNYIN